MKYLILFFLFIPQAFALCEKEREERDHWRQQCHAFELATGVGSGLIGAASYDKWGIVGGITGGVVSGLTLGLVTHNQCRIYEEKKSNLERCENQHVENLNREYEAAMKDLPSLEMKKKIIEKYQFAEKMIREEFSKESEKMMTDFFEKDGDPTDPEFLKKMKDLETYYEELLKKLKSDLDEELKHV